jgi:hypothetical protein
MAQELHQQPGRIAARAACQLQRLLGRLYAGFKADDVADGALHLAIEVDQKVDAGLRRRRDRVEEATQQGRQRQAVQVRFKFFLLPGLVFERKRRRIGFGKEVERVDYRHAGDQVDFDAEFARLFREDQARQIVGLRVLLPVDEMLPRGDLQRVAEDRRARVRRWPQSDDLRRKRDQAVVAIVSYVVEGNMYGHGQLQGNGSLAFKQEPIHA